MSGDTTDAQIAALSSAAVAVAALPLSQSQTIRVDQDAAYDVAGELTVELWVRSENFFDRIDLVGRAKEEDGKLLQGWRLSVIDAIPELCLAVSSEAGDALDYRFRPPPPSTYSQGPARYVDGYKWNHIAVTYRQRTEVVLIVNGTAHPTIMPLELRYGGRVLNAPAPMLIAAPGRVPDVVDIAEIRIWSIAREPNEIAVDRLRQLTGQEDGLIGYWRCDAVTGGRIRNLVANRPDGVLLDHDAPPDAETAPRPSTESDLRLANADALPPDDLQDVLRWRERVTRAKEALEQSTRSYQAQQLLIRNVQRQSRGLNDQIADHARREADAAAAFRRDEAAERVEYRRQLNEVRAGAGTRIAAVVSSLRQQILLTRATLQERGAPYRLARVAIELRATPDGVGAGLILPTEAELQSEAGRLSTMRAEFAALDNPGPPAAATVTVPTLVGYTRVLAARRLAELGLQMAVRYQPVPPLDDEGGSPIAYRVLSQEPEAETRIDAGSTVTITLGEPAARGATAI